MKFSIDFQTIFGGCLGIEYHPMKGDDLGPDVLWALTIDLLFIRMLVFAEHSE